MKELIILRGIPGCGKSTLAQILAGNSYPVFCIDDYFTDKKTGKYSFEFDKNHLAYKYCEERTSDAMASGVQKIFVDNAFTLSWEIESYFKLASQFNYRVHVITVEKYHDNKNIHNISEEQLLKMAEKYKVKLI